MRETLQLCIHYEGRESLFHQVVNGDDANKIAARAPQRYLHSASKLLTLIHFCAIHCCCGRLPLRAPRAVRAQQAVEHMAADGARDGRPQLRDNDWVLARCKPRNALTAVGSRSCTTRRARDTAGC